jgi:CxxC-x17-CxxC domain-containing protein
MISANKTLTCCDCSKTFEFLAGEQEFFAAKGLTHEPKRCANCRVLTRMRRNGNDHSATKTVCEDCGAITLVPFKPRGSKPVYCSVCFRSRQRQSSDNGMVVLLPAG